MTTPIPTRTALRQIRAALGDTTGRIHAPRAVEELLDKPGFERWIVYLTPALDGYRNGRRIVHTSSIIGVFTIEDTTTGRKYPGKASK